MSADNGIYILKTKRTRVQEIWKSSIIDGQPVSVHAWTEAKDHFVYRVAHTTAIDNFGYYKEKQLYNLGAYMKDIWGNSPVFLEWSEALNYANKIEKTFEFTEYGICDIDASDMIFYGDM